jgi:BirA family biotin operon repressor/biotin-[acetyl-CoA-carboxylase] ligase
MITENELREHLTTKKFGRKMYLFERLDSTNTYAKQLASEGCEEGAIVIAEDQYAGRGRQGRMWVAEAGTSLTFSILLKPTIAPESIGILSLYAGLAITEAVMQQSGIRPACKWPNDILFDGKKFCGILSEAVFNNGMLAATIIGAGLNINQLEFPHEIRQSATSLALVNGHTYDRTILLAAILQQLEYWYKYVQSGHHNIILDRWRTHCPMIGQEIAVDQQGTIIRGIASGLADDGGLIIQSNGSKIKMFAGDVTIMKHTYDSRN